MTDKIIDIIIIACLVIVGVFSITNGVFTLARKLLLKKYITRAFPLTPKEKYIKIKDKPLAPKVTIWAKPPKKINR